MPALQPHCEDNRKVARRQSSLLCCLRSLKELVAQQWLTLLAASRHCFQPARNAWVWSQVSRFSPCPSSRFCLRQGTVESWVLHNGALSDRAGKLDLCSERTDSCLRGFHNATIYIRKWAEYFLKKKKKRKKAFICLFGSVKRSAVLVWLQGMECWRGKTYSCMRPCVCVHDA